MEYLYAFSLHNISPLTSSSNLSFRTLFTQPSSHLQLQIHTKDGSLLFQTEHAPLPSPSFKVLWKKTLSLSNDFNLSIFYSDENKSISLFCTVPVQGTCTDTSSWVPLSSTTLSSKLHIRRIPINIVSTPPRLLRCDNIERWFEYGSIILREQATTVPISTCLPLVWLENLYHLFTMEYENWRTFFEKTRKDRGWLTEDEAVGEGKVSYRLQILACRNLVLDVKKTNKNSHYFMNKIKSGWKNNGEVSGIHTYVSAGMVSANRFTNEELPIGKTNI